MHKIRLYSFNARALHLNQKNIILIVILINWSNIARGGFSTRITALPFRIISCHISIHQNSTMRRSKQWIYTRKVPWSKVSKTPFSISFLIHFHGILLLSSHRIVSYTNLFNNYTTQLRTVSAYFWVKLRSETFLGWSFIRNFRCLNRKLGRIDQGRIDQIRIVRGRINQGRIYQGRIDQGQSDSDRSDSDRSDSDRSDSDRSGVDRIDLYGSEIAEFRCLWYPHRICRSSNFEMMNSDDLDYLAPSKPVG